MNTRTLVTSAQDMPLGVSSPPKPAALLAPSAGGEHVITVMREMGQANKEDRRSARTKNPGEVVLHADADAGKVHLQHALKEVVLAVSKGNGKEEHSGTLATHSWPIARVTQTG